MLLSDARMAAECVQPVRLGEMLHILERRLNNDPAEELLESAEQQRQIMQLRLRKWLGPSA